jgi:hypothetical protein
MLINRLFSDFPPSKRLANRFNVVYNILQSRCRYDGIGRRDGFKIRCGRGGTGRLDGFRFRYLHGVRVRLPPPAPNKYNPNQIFLIGDGFGLFVFFEKFEDTHFRNGVVKRPESKPRGPRKPKLVKDKEANYENHQKL